MNLRYRKCRVGEQEKLEQLNKLACDEQLAKYSDQKTNLFDVQEYFAGGGCFWVTEDLESGKIVGMVAVRVIDEKTAKVKALRVHPLYRRKGIAKKLMTILEKFCQGKKIKTIILGVDKDSVAAIGLYQSLGYQKYEEKEFTPDNIAYYFHKKL